MRSALLTSWLLLLAGLAGCSSVPPRLDLPPAYRQVAKLPPAPHPPSIAQRPRKC